MDRTSCEDEAGLIGAAQQGDAAAFQVLVEAYQGTLFNAAVRILGDQDAAADATQEAFISAYRALDGFRGGSFRAWLLRIVTNACYDHLRYNRRRPTSSLEALLVGEGVHHAFTDRAADPERRLMSDDLGRTLQRGLDQLTPEQRTAIVLSDVHGLSYPEVATIEGVPVGTVKSRISRGRAHLRDYLLSQTDVVPRHYRKAGVASAAA
jgi:RNA polymerase sigma-70 factor (ECF subfamily)